MLGYNGDSMWIPSGKLAYLWANQRTKFTVMFRQKPSMALASHETFLFSEGDEVGGILFSYVFIQPDTREYPLVNVDTTMESHIFLMGKSTN